MLDASDYKAWWYALMYGASKEKRMQLMDSRRK